MNAVKLKETRLARGRVLYRLLSLVVRSHTYSKILYDLILIFLPRVKHVRAVVAYNAIGYTVICENFPQPVNQTVKRAIVGYSWLSQYFGFIRSRLVARLNGAIYTLAGFDLISNPIFFARILFKQSCINSYIVPKK